MRLNALRPRKLFSSFHTACAILIMALPLPPVVSIPLTIGSHHFVDKLGEGSINDPLPKELAYHAIDVGVGTLAGQLPLVLGGVLAGNAFDLIDKALAPALGVTPNSVFPCHTDGYSQQLQVSARDTDRANVVATGLALLTVLGQGI